MTMNPTKEQRCKAAIESASYPEHCIRVPIEKWPANMPSGLIDVYRSKKFLVQVYGWKDGAQRMTICRTQISNGNWIPGITWDELQRIKRECGFGECWAVEIFPPEVHLVNVANMRHLWILAHPPAFGWQSASLTTEREQG